MSCLNSQTSYKDLTFKEFSYIAIAQIAIGVKQSTKQDLKSRLERLLIPTFENQKVREITPLKIEQWQNRLVAIKGVDMTRRTKQLLKNILNRAIVYDIIEKNPTLPTSKLKEKNPPQREIYTKKEVSLMLEHSKGWLNLFILTMVSLGVRSSEIIHLKFSDIDFKNRKIHIQGNIRFGKFSLPKNGLKRWVDIPTNLLKELEIAYNQRLKVKPYRDYIFITSKGLYWSDTSCITRRHFKPLLEHIGVKYKGLYSLRHTYATLSLQGGQNIGYISQQLGHKDIKTTMDYYIKYLEDDEDIRRANKILSF